MRKGIEELTGINTRTFAYGDFRVDVVTSHDDGDTYIEGFIYHKDYGIKSHMYGMTISEENGCRTVGDFLDLLFINMPEYIVGYYNDYMDH